MTFVSADENEILTEKLAGLQGDNVYYGPTSGEVAYNEVEGLEDKPETKRTAKEDVKTPLRYELTDKDKENAGIQRSPFQSAGWRCQCR